MAIGPILAQLKRNQLGAVLIALQVALTLAVISNAVFIIHERVALTLRPSGVQDEPDVLVMHNEWLGPADDAVGRLRADLATLRRLPGVIDAYASNSYPLSNEGGIAFINLKPHQVTATAMSGGYLVDDHALATLGLRLIAGRNFTPTELSSARKPPGPGRAPSIPSVIVSRDLAQRLFPGQSALGRAVYLDATHASLIIGVVQSLSVPWPATGGWASDFSTSAMLWPLLPLGGNLEYILRVRPGRRAQVMRAAQEALYAADRDRIVSGVRSLAQARQEAYRDQRGFAIILAGVCLMMLLITACGVVGLTSYWVAQRRRQVGILRALGGTRGAIVQHVQTENLLIALAGTIPGAALAAGLNLWAVESFQSARLPAAYVISGTIALLALGQLAALWPALRAAAVSPALAARSGWHPSTSIIVMKAPT